MLKFCPLDCFPRTILAYMFLPLVLVTYECILGPGIFMLHKRVLGHVTGFVALIAFCLWRLPLPYRIVMLLVVYLLSCPLILVRCGPIFAI